MRLLVFLLLLPSFCFGQYTIPGASQQPAWVFPIYVEDGNGNKDTVYLGYDLDATFNIDTAYGEEWITPDTSVFHVATIDFIDSILKVDIQPFQFNFSISTKNGVTPFKFSWDVLAFYSDSIPFPDQAPLPRAQGEIMWGGLVQTGYGFCFPVSPYGILITDTFIMSPDCMRKDSVVFNWQFDSTANMPLDFGIDFHIVPWEGQPSSLGIKGLIVERNLSIHPNPTTGVARITNTEQGITNVEVYDIFGRPVPFEFDIGRSLMDVRSSPAGVYFVKVGETVRKLIKQ